MFAKRTSEPSESIMLAEIAADAWRRASKSNEWFCVASELYGAGRMAKTPEVKKSAFWLALIAYRRYEESGRTHSVTRKAA